MFGLSSKSEIGRSLVQNQRDRANISFDIDPVAWLPVKWLTFQKCGNIESVGPLK